MTPIETAIEILDVASEAAYRARFAKRVQDKHLTVQPQAAPLVAHINTGRWVTLCPCGAGVAIHPGWGFAACLRCGRVWESIALPDTETLTAIDAALAERPSRPEHAVPYPNYSWTPGETPSELRAQWARASRTRGERQGRR